MTKITLSILAKTPLLVSGLLGYVIGWLLWLLPNKKRRITYINLSLCLPELGFFMRHNLARRSLIHEAQTLLEIPFILSASESQTNRLVKKVTGLEHLQENLKQQRGVILAIPHLGNWEIIGTWCSQRFPMTSLYRPQHRSSELDTFIRTGRQAFGAQLVPTDASGVRALYKALDDNQLLAILPDQNPGKGTGEFANFFHTPANTMVLLPRLAQRKTSPVLFCYTRRLKWGRGFHLFFIPADNAIYDKDMKTATTALNLGLEQCIRQQPQQYWWSYKRFNVLPEGMPSAYLKK